MPRRFWTLIAAVDAVAALAVVLVLRIGAEVQGPSVTTTTSATEHTTKSAGALAADRDVSAARVPTSFVGASGPAADRHAEVSGIVVDPSGEPIAGARVSPLAEGPRRSELGRTDAAGRFEVAAGNVDSIALLVEASGFAYGTFEFGGLGAGTNDVGALVLEPGAILHGRVVDAAGNPVADAEVFTDLDRVTHAVTSDSAGRFALDVLRPGFIHVAARKEGFTFCNPNPVRLWVPAGGTGRSLDLVLLQAHVIAGIVRDTSALPVAGARVSVFTDAPPPQTSVPPVGRLALVESDEAGRFRAEIALVDGPVEVLATTGRHVFGRVETLPGATDVEIVLEPLPAFDLFVRDAATGDPVDDVVVITRRTREASGRPPDLADPQRSLAQLEDVGSFVNAADLEVEPGHFRVPFVDPLRPEGPGPGHWYVIEVSSPMHERHRTAPISFDRIERPRVEVALEPLRAVVGTVRGAGGERVAIAAVRLFAATPNDALDVDGFHGIAVPQPGRPVLRPGRWAALNWSSWVPAEPDGSFRLPIRVGPGMSVLVQGDAPDRARGFSATAAIPERGNLELDVVLAAGGFIEGVVTGLDERPASGEVVVAHDERGNVGSARSGAAGRYRVGPLPPGAYCVRLGDAVDNTFALEWTPVQQREPADASRFDVVVAAGSATRRDVALTPPPGLCVIGTVRAVGSGSASMRIQAEREEGPPVARHGLHGRADGQSTLPDAAGTFRLVDLAPGTWRVTAVGLHGPAASVLARVSLQRGALVHLEGIARCIAGVVRDGATGRPAVVDVLLRAEGSDEELRCTTTHAGQFEFPHLAPAVYEVSIEARLDGQLVRRPVASADARSDDVVDLELTRPTR